MNNDIVLKNIKFSIMLILGLVLVINPTSLLSILLFILGFYFIIIGFNSLISSVILIKFRKGWVYDGVKAAILLIAGIVLVFNTGKIAVTISSLVFVIIGLLIFFIGVMAIIRVKETSAGIILIVLGLLIALFPLGVSNLITRIIGGSLIGLSLYLLLSINNLTKSS
ncbi:hypothetical protein EW093_04320 [Thiospirochaeta perfilievii]|uniref:DUF308 domain-containing protein n=1 Tax=Thiospirochaeta perfilievii TaxID=252967 RepID=A0A5C1Q7F2_9SPIO|nr:DUF308 domain-containing protein [Thiospirochaeta perfilievii]QEN03955.1 hypothetical protein EW093_04320 [Thiospirochaeta perfilievii]